jgi:hypothetical protein
MGVKVEIPKIVRCDNVDAIFIEKTSSGVRSWHINTRYHFVCEHNEGDFIKTMYVKSDNYIADLFTRNVSKDFYVSMQGRYDNSNVAYRKDILEYCQFFNLNKVLGCSDN